MLRKVDRVFLREVYCFTYMVRPAATIAMYDAAADDATTAAKVIKHVLKYTDEQSIEETKRLGIGRRIQDAMVPRIFAECAGAIEDLASLCDAIKNRKNESIFKAYANSHKKHAEFLNEIFNINNENINLAEILNIPTLENLQQILDPHAYQHFEQMYKKTAEQLNGAAKLFKTKSLGDSGNPEDLVYVVTQVDMNKKNKNMDIFAKTYNKIKHRFLVFHNVEDLRQAVEEEGKDLNLQVQIVPFSMKFEDVWAVWRTICMGMGNCTKTIAGMLLYLDDKMDL